MYEEISQEKYRIELGKLIRQDADRLIYGLKVIEPLLDDLRFEELQPLLDGDDGLIETMDVLNYNINLHTKDRLNNDMIYFMDAGLPFRCSKEQYTSLVDDLNVIKKYIIEKEE